jgi:hypothetical protein
VFKTSCATQMFHVEHLGNCFILAAKLRFSESLFFVQLLTDIPSRRWPCPHSQPICGPVPYAPLRGQRQSSLLFVRTRTTADEQRRTKTSPRRWPCPHGQPFCRPAPYAPLRGQRLRSLLFVRTRTTAKLFVRTRTTADELRQTNNPPPAAGHVRTASRSAVGTLCATA